MLLISHTCQSSTEGQPKAQELARLADIDLKVLTPDRWMHYGQWRRAEAPLAEPGFRFEIGKVRNAWVRPAKFYLHYYPGLQETLRRFQPDVIDLWEEPWGLVSAHACWLRNRMLPQAKIISETEQNINKTLPFPFETFRSYTLRNADYAVGRNAESVEVIRSKGFAGPAQVVPNAVDTTLFRGMDRAACQRELGLSGFVVGYVGRLVEEKGLSDLVEAVRLCPPGVLLVTIGSGPMQPKLERMISEAGLSGRVRLLAGRPQSELPRLMNAFNALAVPSWTTPQWKEQFGRVIIEAHACALPVIGSDSGAIPQVIGGGGRITPERNPQALASAIRELEAHPELAHSLGQIGRQQVEHNFTWKSVAIQMASIYRKVLARPATHAVDVEVDAQVALS